MSSSRSPLRVGDLFPNLNAVSTVGEIESLHAYFGGSWGIVMVQPRAFAPVGTVELAEAARLAPEWARRDVRLIALADARTTTCASGSRRVSRLSLSRFFFARAPRSPPCNIYA